MRIIKSFLISFRLRTTYKANGIIYYLKQLPLIKKLIPPTAYGSRGIKLFANIISLFLEIGNIFIWKFLYIACIFALSTQMGADAPLAAFLHMIFFLTIIGGFMNTNIFDPTNDKYYAMILMRMDAKKYTLSNYIYFVIKVFLGFGVPACVFGLSMGLNVLQCLCLPVFMILIKVVSAGIILWYDSRQEISGNLYNENKSVVLVWCSAGILVALAMIPPALGYVIPSFVFYIIFFVLLIPTAISSIYLYRSNNYAKIYKELLSKSPVVTMKGSQANMVQAQTLKKIELTSDSTSNKAGFAYFNELFFKRHRKLLQRPAKKICIASVIIFIGLAIASLLNAGMKTGINTLTLNLLPYFLFLIYLIHPGRMITQAMFMNCDHSMLSYRFYRQPKIVLTLFVERLKMLIVIGLIPAIFIAVELVALLAMTGGTPDFINYIFVFLTIIMMSVFFSVHYMVLYYLLQPYNIALESRNAAYSIANVITYMVCYVAIGKHIPTILFGSVLTVFSVLYIIVSLLLVYRLAPKTFKLR